MFKKMNDTLRRSLAILACVAIAGLTACGEAPAPSAQSGAQPTAAASAPDVVGTPGPTSAETAAGAQATAAAQSAVSRAAVSAAALLNYRTRVAISLQSYANALGALRDRDRQLGDRPALISDAEWKGRATMALQQMNVAADQMTAITPVPAEMAVTDGLIRQIERETRLLNQEYALAIQSASSSATTAAGSRTTPVLALLAQANVELRRGASA